jgi:hypothetical protein
MPPKKNNKQQQQQAQAESADGEIVMGEAPPNDDDDQPKPRSVVARDPRREMALIREDQQRNARYLAVSVMLCKIREEMEDEELRGRPPL